MGGNTDANLGPAVPMPEPAAPSPDVTTITVTDEGVDMTTAAATASHSDTPLAALDRRRTKWLAAEQAAAAAEGALDQQLAAVTARRSANKAELEAVVTRQAELAKEIKGLAKERERLRVARKRAERGVQETRRRTKRSEAKFDKALLANLLRKARTADLTANGGAPAKRSARTRTSAAANGTPQRRAASVNGRRTPR